MTEDVFWKLLTHFRETANPDFCSGKYAGYLSRLKRLSVFLLAPCTIRLTLNCFDCARHRWQKAAANLHMTMELSSRLSSWRSRSSRTTSSSPPRR